MKTNNNISYSRGRTSTSGFNQIKKVVKVLVILIGSIIGLVLWIFIRPIFRGVGWGISLVSALMIIFWLYYCPLKIFDAERNRADSICRSQP